MKDTDVATGKRVAAWRTARNVSQAELARQVTEALGGDTAWHRETVRRVEVGERPLRISEARVIAYLLEQPLLDLLSPGGDRALQIRLRAERLRRATAITAAAIRELRSAASELGAAVQDAAPRPATEDPYDPWTDPLAEWFAPSERDALTAATSGDHLTVLRNAAQDAVDAAQRLPRAPSAAPAAARDADRLSREIDGDRFHQHREGEEP